MAEAYSVEEFLNLPGALFDVRSPGEFLHAHLPGAISLPLFSDAERAIVGTLYKQKGHEQALLKGLELTGPKMAAFAEIALSHKAGARIYCFRGGLRSQSMGWLFSLMGIPCKTLKGGYKAFRRFALGMFQKPFSLQVVGGLTGSGKTAYLKEAKARGEQVIDLEDLAGHRGSAFGLLGYPPQTGTEHFENRLALELFSMDLQKPILIEDESRMIGSCKIPDAFFQKMLEAPLLLLDTPLEERIERLLSDYGGFPKEKLIEAVEKLARKLGGEKKEKVVLAILDDRLHDACRMLLEYYDSTYKHHLSKFRRSPCIL